MRCTLRYLLLFGVLALALLAACDDDDDDDNDVTPTEEPSASATNEPTSEPTSGATGEPTGGDPGTGAGPGLSVSEALESPLDDLLLVNGALVVVDGEARLCEALAESFPPQCGGASLLIVGIDLENFPGLTTEGNTSWTDQPTQLLGRVSNGTLTVSTSSSSSGTSAPPNGENVKHDLTIEVIAGEFAPEDFGAAPGDPIVGATIVLTPSGADAADQITVTTDDAGRAVVEVRTGAYDVFIEGDTPDPLCTWLGSALIAVDGPTTLVVDDMAVACQ